MDATTEPLTLAEWSVAGQPRQIVVGVDGSLAAGAALEWAIAEAEAAGAELLVCHAYTPKHIVRPLPAGAVGPIGEEQARQRLQTAVARAVRRLGRRRVHGELRLGDPAAALIEAAGRAQLLVVGSYGNLGQASRLLGSTALRVAAHAACPAVVVRPLVAGARGPFAGHVVVGVDGAATAPAALEVGFRSAARHDLPLAAVHVATGWPGDFWTDDELLQTYFATEPSAQTGLAVEVEPFHHRFPTVPVKRAVYGGDPGARPAARCVRRCATGTGRPAPGQRAQAGARLGQPGRGGPRRLPGCRSPRTSGLNQSRR